MKRKIMIILVLIISFFSFVLLVKADEQITISDTYFRLDTANSQILPGYIETNYSNVNDLFDLLNIYVAPSQTLKKDYIYKAVFIISTHVSHGDTVAHFSSRTGYRSFGRRVGSSEYGEGITYLSSEYEDLTTGNFAQGYRYTVYFRATADLSGILLQVFKKSNNIQDALYMDRFKYEGAAIYQVSNSDNAINTIIDILGSQNQTIIDQNNQTNNKLDDLNNNITDETLPDTSEFGDVAGWLPAGPVDSILTLPLNVLNSISNSLNSNCSSVNLPLPFIKKELSLMCGTEFYKNISGLNIFLNTLFTILGGITLYKYFVYLYNWIDRIASLKEKDEKWGAT